VDIYKTIDNIIYKILKLYYSPSRAGQLFAAIVHILGFILFMLAVILILKLAEIPEPPPIYYEDFYRWY